MIILFILVLAVSAGITAQAAESRDEKMVKRSLVRLGDTTRLERVMRKSLNGEKIIIGVLGGSITEGALATSHDKRWANQVAQWWREQFPKAEVELINAGIGATGSAIGSHRAYMNLLHHRPDFIIVEYSVNDRNDPLATECMEGIIRQALSLVNQPAVMQLFMCGGDCTSEQDEHEKVGRYYHLPMVSFRDAVAPEFKSGRIASTDIIPDYVHPNDTGHKLCARFITNALERVREKVLNNSEESLYIKPVSAPLVNDIFEHTALLMPSTCKPKSKAGWSLVKLWHFGKAWESADPGSVIEFEVDCDTVGVIFYRAKNMGMVECRVDDHDPVRLDACFVANWGGYAQYALVARGLGAGKHTVQIQLLDQKSEKSNGNRFVVLAVACAGMHQAH
ncbi:MAG: SGNH/GDSL hydrolase family protein [Armatimonadota bacterium]|nr:SGNH/GDSL hydrolase family protein [bacterium]